MKTGTQPLQTNNRVSLSSVFSDRKFDTSGVMPLLDEEKIKMLVPRQGIDFFVMIDYFVYDDFKNQLDVHKALQRLSRLKGSPEDILLSIRNNDFSVYDTTPDEFKVLLELAHLQNKLKVAYINEIFRLLTSDQVGILSWEKKVLPDLLEIALIIDQIYIKWRSSLFPRNVYSLQEPEKKEFDNKLACLNDPYTIIAKGPLGYEQIPYGVFFYKEVRRLLKHAVNIRELLSNIHRDDKIDAFLRYLSALESAWQIDQSCKLDGEWASVLAWREVDRAWLAYRGNLQIWHGVESGYDKTLDISGIRIIPEWRITYLDESKRHHRMNMYLKLIQSFYPNYFDLRYFFHEQVSHQIQRIRSCDIGIHSTIMGAGASLDFCPHGQIAPNEPIAARSGFKSTLDSIKEGDAYEKEKFLLGNLCEGKRNEDLTQYILGVDEHLGIYVGSHELSHALLGEWEDLEEFKASWTGLLPLKEAEEVQMLRKNIFRDAIVSHFICCLKYLTSDDQKDPYYIESLIHMGFFIECGFLIKKENEKWILDVNRLLNGDNHYFQLVNVFYHKLLSYSLAGDMQMLLQEGRKRIIKNDQILVLTQDVRRANLLYLDRNQKK